jgi:hypothetical protein
VADDDSKESRIYIRPSTEVEAYLQDLVTVGIHGKTKSEVAKTLISNQIERLIKDGILQLRRPDGR